MFTRRLMSRLLPILMLLSLAGCGREEIVQRRYREVTTRQAPVAASAPAQVALSWQAPDGWEERSAGNMVRAEFAVGDQVCTISSFFGDVGGMEANLNRWLGQLGVENPSAAEVDGLLAGAVELAAGGGMSGRLLDFASLAPGDESMLTAVFEKEGWSVFVKLMGPRSLLAEERERFVQLCESLQ